MKSKAANLLVTDASGSVLNNKTAYSPFGYWPDLSHQVGFCGYPHEQQGMFLLGKGYRAYHPTLQRFNRPDVLSPFGAGGINAYAYCQADPVNNVDPSGRMTWPLMAAFYKKRMVVLPRRPITALQTGGRPVAVVRPVRMPASQTNALPGPAARSSVARELETVTPAPFTQPGTRQANPTPASPSTSQLATNGRIEPSLPLLRLAEVPRIRPLERSMDAVRPLSRESRRSSRSSRSSLEWDYDSDDSFSRDP